MMQVFRGQPQRIVRIEMIEKTPRQHEGLAAAGTGRQRDRYATHVQGELLLIGQIRGCRQSRRCDLHEGDSGGQILSIERT